MNFKKYNSIENSYQQKNILKFMQRMPDAFKQKWIVRSKLDGANIQLLLQPNEPMKVGKRTSYVEQGDPFFDIWTTLKNYSVQLQYVQDYCNAANTPLRFYGEIYGPGINGRVNYGETKKIALFDLEQGDILMPQFALISCLEGLRMTNLLPPLMGIFDTFEQALDQNPEYDSKILGIPNNPEEGLVIQPYEENIILPTGERFILKKKGVKFLESENKNHKPKKEVSGETISKLQSFQSYINENRMLSTFSKHGEIADKTQMGDYIRWILEDAKEDFYKDNEGLVLNQDEQKIVFNVGKQIVELLRARL